MELSYEQIRSITTGVVYFEESKEGLNFHRFSKEQECFLFGKQRYYPEEYFNTKFEAPYFGLMAKTTAGVTFDFYTDATKICIKVGKLIIPADAYKQNFDVYINGKYNDSFIADENIEFRTKKGDKRVTIYFPWVNYPTISGVALNNATYFNPASLGTEVLCMGDSITHGGVAAHPSNTWVSIMARKLGVTVLNQGLSGFVNDKDVVETVCEPKVVITAYGVNDYGRKTSEQLERDTDEFIKKVKKCYPKSKICSILPLWTVWNTDPGNWYDDKREILKRVYDKNGVFIIDGMKMIPHNVKYLHDGLLHLNDKGFIYYGNRVANIIKDLI